MMFTDLHRVPRRRPPGGARMLAATVVTAVVAAGAGGVAPAPAQASPRYAPTAPQATAPAQRTALAPQATAPAQRTVPAPQAAAPAQRYAEREAPDRTGGNDTMAVAEPLTGFGTGAGRNPKAVLGGGLALRPGIVTLPTPAEDDGSIPLATDTGLAGANAAVRVDGFLGDGPHGVDGDRTGDFDYYKVGGVPKRTALTIDLDTAIKGDDRSGLNKVVNAAVVVWSPAGTRLGRYQANSYNPDNLIEIFLPDAGDYYLMVTLPYTSPGDPFDSGSGDLGSYANGPYSIVISTRKAVWDTDLFAADLRAGDVVGAALAGGGQHLALLDAADHELIGSTWDNSGMYPAASPLPGGGNATIDFVVPRDGRYAIAVTNSDYSRAGAGGPAAYTVTLEVYRPGTETDRAGTVQTIYLDFDGARVNTSAFKFPPLMSGRSQREIAPISDFLPGLGLTAADQNALIDAVVARVRRNIATEPSAGGGNPELAVRILDSRHAADPFGQPNVSRVVIGDGPGTVAGGEFIAYESVDPGNFAHEETGLVVMGMLSQFGSTSLSRYLTDASDRVGFIGRVVGDFASHAIGHLSGSWDTDDRDGSPLDLMNANFCYSPDGFIGPTPNVDKVAGIGPDRIGGTADDEAHGLGLSRYFRRDYDIGPTGPEGVGGVLDRYDIGTQDSLNRTAWAYRRGDR